MVEAIYSSRSRRLPLWVIIAAAMACVLTGAFVLLWIKLPIWAPGWVVEHSPWLDPIVRAVKVGGHHQRPTMLRQTRGQSVVPMLIPLFADESSTVRAWTLASLSGIKDDRMAVPLINMLLRVNVEFGSDDLGTQEIRDALSYQRRDAVIEALLPIPDTKDWDVVPRIDYAGRIADVRVVDALRKILWEPERAPKEKLDEWFGGRGALAAAALAKMPDEMGEATLLAALSDGDPRVRKRAVLGASLFSGPRRNNSEHLTSSVLDAIKSLILDPDASVRGVAASTAIELGISGVEDSLMTLSYSQDPKDRWIAVSYLDCSKPISQRAHDRMVDCLEDQDGDVRFAAVHMLCTTSDDSRSIAPLLTAAASPDVRVRQAVAKWLGIYAYKPGPNVVPTLLHLLDDPELDVGAAAGNTLLRACPLSDEERARVTAAMERFGMGDKKTE